MAQLAVLWLLALSCWARCWAAVFTVTHAGDSGVASLRWAMESANIAPGMDEVRRAGSSPASIC